MRRARHSLSAVIVVLVAAGAFLATPAAAFTEPGITGNTSDFANCPFNSLVRNGDHCIHSYVTGGVVQIGHSSVPISVPGDTFDVGATEEEEEVPICFPFGFTECVISPLHGILNGPAQPVPGGLLGVIGNPRVTAVKAKVEWAAPVAPETPFGNTTPCGGDPLVTFDLCKLLNGRSGTATTLSLKVHLISPFLGPDCYIGSAAEPLVIPLTTGTTDPPPPAQPIHGRSYEYLLKRVGAIQLLGVTLVGNSFSVPAAHGCGTGAGDLLDSAINHKLGLPSPAGQNTMIVEATGEELGRIEITEAGGIGESNAPEEPTEEEAPAASAAAGPSLPNGRAYELVSPVSKNGLSPYAAVPSEDDEAVDFQTRGALPGSGSGALNLYRATRDSGGWQTASLTPTPSPTLGTLELQAPLWTSGDLSQTIFSTPASFAAGDQDGGALSLYGSEGAGGMTLLSQGTQGGSEEKSATFDAATPDGQHVIFSSGASLLPEATGLDPEAAPEAQYLYQRDVGGGATHLLSLDANGQPAGYAATTLSVEYTPGVHYLTVTNAEGFFPGQLITIGTGPTAETTQILQVLIEGGPPVLVVGNGYGLPSAFPAGTPVIHLAEGAILGDGANLASGSPPAGEYLPANAGSGTTTNAISADGSKAFFEAPSPTTGNPPSLYMRRGNSATIKIAGGAAIGVRLSGFFAEQQVTSSSARYQGAAADGSLVFFTSDEGLGGVAVARELYEFNTTEGEIGGLAPLSARPLSAGLGGDSAPATTFTTEGHNVRHLTVASTAGFYPGEAVTVAPFESAGFGSVVELAPVTIASVDSPTQLTLTTNLAGSGSGIPVGTEVHAVHPAHTTAISNDGSHVYFVSDGVLAENENAQGAEAVPVKPNLYVFDTNTGETTFIATLAKSDVEDANGNPTALAARLDLSRPAVPTPDGTVLAFASAGNLTGQNPSERHTEIYRYSVAGEALQCLSCTAPGVPPSGDADFGETAGGTYDPPGLSSPMSEDGSQVFFDSPDSLVSADQNAGSPPSPKFEDLTSTDVYQWTPAGLSLLSAGTATTPATLQGTDPSGRDVLFTSTSQLVPGQGDGGYENLFDARLAGGFPEPGAGAPSCVGTGCREAFGSVPVFSVPASQGSGEGNVHHRAKKKKHRRRHRAKKAHNRHARSTRSVAR